MYFDFFDGAFYINLESRADRMESFESQTRGMGISIPRYIAAPHNIIKIDEKDHFRGDPRRIFKLGGALSHTDIVRIADAKKWRSVLIFEDDCIFCEDFLEKLGESLKDLREVDWNVFYLGGDPNMKCEKLTQNLRRCPNSGGIYQNHGYAVNQNFYKRVLSWDPKTIAVIDSHYMHQPDRNYVISKDLLVYQSDDFVSDLWGCRIKRWETYKDSYEKFVL